MQGWETPVALRAIIGRTPEGLLVVQELEQPVVQDEIMSYASNLSMWATHHMHMKDMAREGDFNRALLASKLNIPIFLLSFKA